MVNNTNVGQKVFQANSYSVSECLLVALHEGEWSAFATVTYPAMRGTLLRETTTLERVATLFATSAEAYAEVNRVLAAYEARIAARNAA